MNQPVSSTHRRPTARSRSPPRILNRGLACREETCIAERKDLGRRTVVLTSTDVTGIRPSYYTGIRILVQVAIYRRLLIGRDGHLDQSEAYGMS